MTSPRDLSRSGALNGGGAEEPPSLKASVIQHLNNSQINVLSLPASSSPSSRRNNQNRGFQQQSQQQPIFQTGVTIDTLADAMNLEPDNELYRRFAVRYAHQVGAHEEAARWSEDWLTRHRTTESLWRAAQSHLALSTVKPDADARQKHADRALELISECTDELPSNPGVRAYKSMYVRALLCAYRRDIEGTIMWATRAIDLNRCHLFSWGLLVNAMTSAREWKKARKALESAQREFPTSVLFGLLSAQIDTIRGQHKMALATSRRVLVELQHIGKFLQDKREGIEPKAGASRAFATQHIQDERHLLAWLCALARCFLSLKDFEAVSTCATAAESVLPGIPLEYQTACECDVVAVRGQLLTHCQQPEQARALLRRVLHTASNHAAVQMAMGLACAKLNDATAARHHLELSLRLDPTSPEGWRAMAGVHRAAQRLECAADCLTTAVKLEYTAPALPLSLMDEVL
eukprot:PhM_4_TR11357/c0_g1_i2/m.1554